MQEFLSVTKKEFLDIVKSYYNKSYAVGEITDIADMLKFAELHQLKGLLCHMLLNGKPKAEYDERLIKSVYLSAIQTGLIFSRESERLKNFLTENGIYFYFLKGQYVKRYYEPEAIRSMGDVDVYVMEADTDKVKEYFTGNGYKQTLYYDKVYNFRNSLVEFELHNSIEWFGVDWAAEASINECLEPVYQLKLAIIHAMKHIVNFGCGIRQLLDIALMLKANGVNGLKGDFEDKIAKLRLTKCYFTLLGVIDKWFDTSYSPADTDKNAVDILEQVVLDGGVFGFNVNDYASINIVKNNSKTKMLLSMLFPKYERMVLSYPKLENKKYLLPYYYVYRLINKGLKGKKYKEIYINDERQNAVDNRKLFVDSLELKEQYYNKNI